VLKKLSILEPTPNNNEENETTNSLLKSKISQIKKDNNFQEILGISELDQEKTQEFIKENNISEIAFLIDENKQFIKANKLSNRFEAVINESGELEEYRMDPTTLDLLYLGASSFSFFIIFLFLSLGVGFYTMSFNQENKRRRELMNIAFKI
jgi:hypothetical protein